MFFVLGEKIMTFVLSRLTFNFRNLSSIATSNPRLGAAIDLDNRWPTRLC